MTNSELTGVGDQRLRRQLGWASALLVLLIVVFIVCLTIGPASGAAGSCGGG